MNDARRLASAALALGLLLPFVGSARPAGATQMPAPSRVIPSPAPTKLPYPAYGTPAPGVAHTQPNAAVPQRITLGQAIDIAAAKSPILASARADYNLSTVPLQLARSAVYPNVSGVASITRSGSGARAGGNFGSGATPSPSSGAFTTTSLDLSIRQLIFDGGRVVAQIHSAQAGERSAAGTYERNLQTLAFDVAQAYYNALQARAATSLAVQVVRQNVVQENLVRAQIRAGTEARANLLAAEVPTAQARVALVRAQGAELSTTAAFANVMGLDANTAVAPVDDTPKNPAASLLATPALDYNTAVTRATALRPDYVAAQQTVNAAQYTLQAAKLGRFPTLNASATGGASEFSPGGSGFRTSNSIGATLTIPIFDQGITAAQSAQAQYQLDKANAQLQGTLIGVQLNVRQALVGLITAQAAVQQTQVELQNAQEQVKATQAQYRAGVTNLPLLLQAQLQLTTSQNDQLNAIYGLRQAEQGYLYAIGQSDLTPAR